MKYIYISIFFILNLFISNNVTADQSVIKELQKGWKIVFIRHSLAPGNGDPDNIDLKKCDTQRNLNEEGIEQAKKIETFWIILGLKTLSPENLTVRLGWDIFFSLRNSILIQIAYSKPQIYAMSI